VNRTRLLFGGPFIALCLMIGFGGVDIRAHDSAQLAPQEEQGLRADVAKPRLVTFSILARQFTGALTQPNIQAQIESAVDEAVRQDLDSVWGTFRPVPVVILLEDPTGKKQVRMEIGLTLPPNAKVKAEAPLKVTPIRFEKGVRHIHRGPHARLGDVFRSIAGELKKDGQNPTFPVVLQILDDPTRINPEQVRTIVNVQVK
jgi:hypothetical protein